MVLEITSLPKNNPTVGTGFFEERGIQRLKPDYEFRMLRVEGYVKWKEHGPGAPEAGPSVLKLKRIPNGSEIQLTVFKHSDRSKHKYLKSKFDIAPDPDIPFWDHGSKRKILPTAPCQKEAIVFLLSLRLPCSVLLFTAHHLCR